MFNDIDHRLTVCSLGSSLTLRLAGSFGSFDCQVNYVILVLGSLLSLVIVWVIRSVGSSGYTGSQVSEPVQHRAWLIAFQCALRLWGKYRRRPNAHEALRPRRGANSHPSIRTLVIALGS